MNVKASIHKAMRFLIIVGWCFFVFGLVVAASTWFQLSSVVSGRAVDVPDLYGLTLDEAREGLENLGLVMVEDPVPVYNDVVTQGRILYQVPQPKKRIKTGRQVEVTLSLGPEEKTVPDLTGESVNFSEMILARRETQPGTLSHVPHPAIAKGRILAQNPPAGQSLGLMNGVSLLVSEGPFEPYYVTPHLVGKSYPEIKKFLDDHDFRVVVKVRGGDPSEPPTILRQFPQAGYPIQKNHPITLEVNRE